MRKFRGHLQNPSVILQAKFLLSIQYLNMFWESSDIFLINFLGGAAQQPVNVSRCDFRVGKIVHCEKHPDADTLYVEKSGSLLGLLYVCIIYYSSGNS